MSFIIGGFFATILLLLGKKKMGQTLPFGPFLVLAFALTYFWGSEILAWYLGLIL
jgi:leader peptidase (prepilin peptidase)/N-methyltransferase